MTAQDLLARLSHAQRLQSEQGLSTAAALTLVWYATALPVPVQQAAPPAPQAETLDDLMERLVQRFRA